MAEKGLNEAGVLSASLVVSKLPNGSIGWLFVLLAEGRRARGNQVVKANMRSPASYSNQRDSVQRILYIYRPISRICRFLVNLDCRNFCFYAYNTRGFCAQRFVCFVDCYFNVHCWHLVNCSESFAKPIEYSDYFGEIHKVARFRSKPSLRHYDTFDISRARRVRSSLYKCRYSKKTSGLRTIHWLIP